MHEKTKPENLKAPKLTEKRSGLTLAMVLKAKKLLDEQEVENERD